MLTCTELFEAYRRRGDLAALGALFDRLAPQLLPIALHLCGEPAAAEDALQQTFVLAIERAASFDNGRRVEPWLVGLLTNIARNTRRAAQRHRAELLPELAASDRSPAHAAERRELIAHLRTQVDTLPHEQRQAILLQLEHGLPPAAIAEVLGVPPGTVRMRLHRGLAALRRVLPASLAALLCGTLATRGLAAVRGDVLSAAARVAVPTLTSAVVVGTSLAMKKLLSAVAVLLLGTCLWLWLAPNEPAHQAAQTPGERSDARLDGALASATPPALDRASPTPDVARQAATGSLRVRAQASHGSDTLPVTGLFVLVWRGDSTLAPFDGSARRLTTDTRGELRLDDLAPGPVHVAVPAEGGETRSSRIEPGQQTLLEIALTARLVVRGRVVDATDRPVEGADLWLHRGTYLGAHSLPDARELLCRLAGRSDAAGEFTVAIIAPQESRISASRDGYGESYGRYVNNPRRELKLVLLADAARLRGVVRDARGAPVADALVTLSPKATDSRRGSDGTLFAGRAARQTRSAPDGSFEFVGLAPSQVTVAASAEPAQSGASDLTVPAGATTMVELTLRDLVSVVGTARYADGSPARVQVASRNTPSENGHYSQCDTRADGSFFLPYQERRSFWVVAGRGDETLAAQQIVAPQPGTLRCDLVVAGHPLRGRVVDPAGRGLAGWRVVVTEPGSPHEPRSTSTAADGSFVLRLEHDGAVTVQTMPATTQTAAAQHSGARPGTAVQLTVPFAALPSARVVGRVHHADDTPLSDRRVELLVGGSVLKTTTGLDGGFEFRELLPGGYEARLVHGGVGTPLGGAFELAVGELRDMGTHRLPAQATLIPEFVLESGRPWAAEPPGIMLHDERGQVQVAQSVIADQTVITAPPGAYRLTLNATDLIAPELRVQLDTAAPTRLRVPLRIGRSLRITCNADGAIKPEPKPPISFTVRDAAGQVVLERQVRVLYPDLRGFRYAYLDHTFAFGRYEAEAEASDGTRYRGTFDVAPSLDTPSAIDLPRQR